MARKRQKKGTDNVLADLGFDDAEDLSAKAPQTFALLKILELGNRQIAQGKVKPVAEVVRRLRARKAPD